MGKIEIDVLSKEDWETYRSLRLTSLKDSPEAFGSTYGRELAFSKSDWKSRIDYQGDAIHLLPLVGKYEGTHVGLAFGAVHKQESNCAHLYQMWVSPNYRGKGIGQALLKRITSWAQELHLNCLLLAVTTTNIAAVSLYRSVGFVDFGKPKCNPPIVVRFFK